MKQNKLYYFLAVICLIIISVIITILVMSNHNMYKSQSQSQSQNISKSRNVKTVNYPDYQNYDDIDYAYNYDGYWIQPNRWWNNLWQNRKVNMYNIRDNYDRRDGLDMNNRYVNNNNIHINTQPKHQNTQSQLESQSHLSNQSHPEISLVKSLSNDESSLPTLTSSSLMMPEEISMSPMSKMSSSENIMQTTFSSDIPSSNQKGYVSNFDYKGSDSKNQNSYPIDMMTSESIFLQPNTLENQIIVSPIVMEHPNPM